MPTNQDPFQTSAGFLGEAGGIYSDMQDPGSLQDPGFKNPGFGNSLQNINEYMNPYYNQVLSSVLGRMEDQKQVGLDQIGDQAVASGAFGGGRHGLQEGTFRGEHSQAVGDVTGNLLMQQFDSAAERAYRDQATAADNSFRNRSFAANDDFRYQSANADNLFRGLIASAQGQTQLGDQFYGIGTDIADRQAQAGGQQQDLMQQILAGGANMFDQYMENPYQMMDMLQSLLSGDARRGQGSSTQQSTPGIYDYVSLAAQAAGGI